MKIYIELLIPVVLLVIFILWRIWFSFSKRRLIKKYNPDDDKSRKGEINRRAIGSREHGIETTTDRTESEVGNIPRDEPLRKRELLPNAEVSIVGKNSNSNRKSSSGIGRLLKRRRRRKE